MSHNFQKKKNDLKLKSSTFLYDKKTGLINIENDSFTQQNL